MSQHLHVESKPEKKWHGPFGWLSGLVGRGFLAWPGSFANNENKRGQSIKSKEVQKGWPLLYDRAQRENRWLQTRLFRRKLETNTWWENLKNNKGKMRDIFKGMQKKIKGRQAVSYFLSLFDSRGSISYCLFIALLIKTWLKMKRHWFHPLEGRIKSLLSFTLQAKQELFFRCPLKRSWQSKGQGSVLPCYSEMCNEIARQNSHGNVNSKVCSVLWKEQVGNDKWATSIKYQRVLWLPRA